MAPAEMSAPERRCQLLMQRSRKKDLLVAHPFTQPTFDAHRQWWEKKRNEKWMKRLNRLPLCERRQSSIEFARQIENKINIYCCLSGAHGALDFFGEMWEDNKKLLNSFSITLSRRRRRRRQQTKKHFSIAFLMPQHVGIGYRGLLSPSPSLPIRRAAKYPRRNSFVRSEDAVIVDIDYCLCIIVHKDGSPVCSNSIMAFADNSISRLVYSTWKRWRESETESVWVLKRRRK